MNLQLSTKWRKKKDRDQTYDFFLPIKEWNIWKDISEKYQNFLHVNLIPPCRRLGPGSDLRTLGRAEDALVVTHLVEDGDLEHPGPLAFLALPSDQLQWWTVNWDQNQKTGMFISGCCNIGQVFCKSKAQETQPHRNQQNRSMADSE